MNFGWICSHVRSMRRTATSFALHYYLYRTRNILRDFEGLKVDLSQ